MLTEIDGIKCSIFWKHEKDEKKRDMTVCVLRDVETKGQKVSFVGVATKSHKDSPNAVVGRTLSLLDLLQSNLERETRVNIANDVKRQGMRWSVGKCAKHCKTKFKVDYATPYVVTWGSTGVSG